MRKFFAFFRRMFAIDRAYEVLAAVIYDAINRIYIPELKDQAENTESLDGREAIEELIEEYKKYADPKTAEGRGLAEIAAKVVGATATKYRNSGVVAEDVIQQMAGDFFDTEFKRGVSTFAKFKAEDGPVKLKNYWSRVLSWHSEYQFREANRKLVQKNKRMKTDEGEGLDPIDRIPAAPEKIDIEERIIRMRKFVPKNIEHYMVPGRRYTVEVAIEIFNLWSEGYDLDNDLDKGPEEVFSEWEKMRKQQGKSYGRSLFNEGLTTLKRVLKAWLIEEKRFERFGREAGKTTVERVAKAEFRIRFAKWMLGE